MAAAIASAASAHHSGSAYDMTRPLTIEGTVKALSWTNPHVFMTIETHDRDGTPLLQEIEAMSVSQARGLGLRREAISPGQRVTVRAYPNRRGTTQRAFGLTVTTSAGAVLPLSSFARLSVAPPPVMEARGLSGAWVPTVESFVTVVSAAAAAPLTDAGRAARDDALSRYMAPDGTGVAICEPLPLPLLHVFPDLRTIRVTDTTVEIRTETNGVRQDRVVHLGQPTHPTNVEPTNEGHSIGRWEAGTLVIHTVGFAPPRTPNLIPVPTHPGTQLTEKLTLMEDRRYLQYEVTLDAPEYLAEPATFRATWEHRSDLEPSDVACDPEAARR
jgi:hypothetical protein